MGYYEVLCRICGVSFNISRFRTDGEPAEAAWRNTGDGIGPFAVIYDELMEVECVREGCYFLHRPDASEPNGTGQRWPPPTSKYADPDYDPEEDDWESDVPDAEEYEHIAGPECGLTGAYSGARISTEAMRGCNTVQCLVPKDSKNPEAWKHEPDDEPFEAEGDYFLSGLSDNMGSLDCGGPTVYPERHDCKQPSAATDGGNDGHSWAMPFHPTCLELFKRASLEHSGAIDVAGLTAWYTVEASFDDVYYDFPRDSAAKAGRNQFWSHNNGHEFLAANPCFVPELNSILSKAKFETHTPPQKAALSGVEVVAGDVNVSDDVLLMLPYDIRYDIALRLEVEDLASLGRASRRAFRDLSQSLSYARLRRDMPWFYEAWCSLPISPWATTTEKTIRRGEQPQAICMEPLDREVTDWAYLEMELVRVLETTALGLQNRRRIWKDCEEILRRIDKHREDGRIGPLSGWFFIT